MSSRTLLNLALLGLAAVLAAVVYFEPGIAPPPEPKQLTQLQAENIHSIRILRAGKANIQLQREGTQWLLQEPLDARADRFRIAALLRITSATSYASYPLAGTSLTELGLENPEVRLFLNDTEFRFGGTEPLNGRRYVQVGSTIHLINDFAYYHLIGGYPTFLSPKVLPDGASISGLDLPGLTLQWQDGQWQVNPRPKGFSADQANQLVDEWRFATAMQVDKYTGQGGEPLRIHLKGNQSLELRLVSRSPELIIADPKLGVQYHFPAEREKELLGLTPIKREVPAPLK